MEVKVKNGVHQEPKGTLSDNPFLSYAQAYFKGEYHKRVVKRTIFDSPSLTKVVKEAFHKRFQIRPDKVAGRVVVVDNITFIVELKKNNEIKYVQILGDCPHHGERVLSKICYHDWEIGEMLVRFQPGSSHVCKIK